MKLIDKDKVVAEIERIRTYYEKLQTIKQVYNGHIDNCNDLLDFLDTLEVKEVDLDNELDFVKDAYYYFTSDERSSMMKVARHFYELGLKVKKGE